MKKYQAYIKNVTKDSWLKDEINGRIVHTFDVSERLVFFDEIDAGATIEFLNEEYSDCYVLLQEENVIYTYVNYVNADEPKEITENIIREEIEAFLTKTNISEFKNLNPKKENKLKERLYNYCACLGEHSRYYPSTYLDSIDDEDIAAILADI